MRSPPAPSMRPACAVTMRRRDRASLPRTRSCEKLYQPFHTSVVRDWVARVPRRRWDRFTDRSSDLRRGEMLSEGDEGFTGPESGDPLARHPVASGGGVVHLHGVGSISTSNHDEVTSLDPDQRWQWE